MKLPVDFDKKLSETKLKKEIQTKFGHSDEVVAFIDYFHGKQMTVETVKEFSEKALGLNDKDKLDVILYFCLNR